MGWNLQRIMDSPSEHPPVLIIHSLHRIDVNQLKDGSKTNIGTSPSMSPTCDVLPSSRRFDTPSVALPPPCDQNPKSQRHRMCQKKSRQGRKLAWLNEELSLELKGGKKHP